jgi:hypothetical protein
MTWATSFYFENGLQLDFEWRLHFILHLLPCVMLKVKPPSYCYQDWIWLGTGKILYPVNHCRFLSDRAFSPYQGTINIFNSSLSLSNLAKRRIAIGLGSLSISWKLWKSEISYCCFYLALKPEFLSSCRHFKEPTVTKHYLKPAFWARRLEIMVTHPCRLLLSNEVALNALVLSCQGSRELIFFEKSLIISIPSIRGSSIWRSYHTKAYLFRRKDISMHNNRISSEVS